MHDYEIHWKYKKPHEFEHGAIQARYLAEEIIAGWRGPTSLSVSDYILTIHALEHFSEMIQHRLVEAHHDEFACNTIALAAQNLALWMLEREGAKLGYDETVLAARALRVFSGFLQKGPPLAAAA